MKNKINVLNVIDFDYKQNTNIKREYQRYQSEIPDE